MAELNDLHSFSSQLLAQDKVVTDDEYRDYREKLARALTTARRHERTAYWVCVVSGVISFPLMFVGGSNVFGSFDPWSSDATPLSVALGVIFVTSSILFWVLLASFYSRFRPRARRAEESLRDVQILQMSARLDSLQRDVASLMNDRRGAESNSSIKNSPPTE